MLNPVPTSYVYEPPTDPWLQIVHEDDRIVVLDKPRGLPSVAGKDPALSDGLEARVKARYPGAAMAHRLDKDTSGILVMALDRRALADIGQQFEKRRTVKTYVARVFGDVAGE